MVKMLGLCWQLQLQNSSSRLQGLVRGHTRYPKTLGGRQEKCLWAPCWGALLYVKWCLLADKLIVFSNHAIFFPTMFQVWIPQGPNTPEPARKSAWILKMLSLWKPFTQMQTVGFSPSHDTERHKHGMMGSQAAATRNSPFPVVNHLRHGSSSGKV